MRAGYGAFKAQADHFRAKVRMPSERWDDLWQGEHTRAFMAAGVARDNVLAEVQTAVQAAIEDGETLEDFRKRFGGIIQRHGWPGGAGNESDARRAWRTSVIYHTNLRTSYMAGRWETLKTYPYLRYQHNTVRNPREEHQAWHDKIIATDDPWWQTHYPPNGWGCRCSVTGVSQARLRAMRGKDGQPDEAPPAGKGDPPPEWAYHVGVADSGRHVDPLILEAERQGRMRSLTEGAPADFGRPEHVPMDASDTPLLPRIRDPQQLADSFRAVMGGDARAFTDPTGTVVQVTDRLLEHWLEDMTRLQGREQYLPLLQEAIEDPFEVWVAFAENELTGKVSLRRRYIKGVQVQRSRILGVVLDAVGGEWVSFNMFSGGPTAANNLRTGRLLWGR